MTLDGIHIISLIGQQGTGKTTLAKAIAPKIGYRYIEASDVVRKICGDMPRGLMYTTNERTKHEWNWLGKGIANEMLRCVGTDYGVDSNFIVSGVRERENHDYFLEQGADLEIIKLWAPENERYARVKKNGKVATYLEFIKHGEGELSIGLRELLLEPYQEIVTAGRLVEATVEELMDTIKWPTRSEWI